MKVLEKKRILVMGLLDLDSLAWAIGQRAEQEGADVIYTVQNERFREVLLRRSFSRNGLDVDRYNILPCDVTSDDDVAALFRRVEPPLNGLVYSIAYAKPESCLTGALTDAPREDVLRALEISAASLAFVAREAQRQHLGTGGSIVAMTFESRQAMPSYNWMGVCKAALEATARYLARDLGPSGIRVNCLSAGPQKTAAATHISGYRQIGDLWGERAPLGWDPVESRVAIAGSAVYLLSDLSTSVTGEVLHVDGGFHAVAL